jgi:DNA-binding NarL/FixJ family response regulator
VTPGEIRQQVQALQQAIACLQLEWTIAVCSSDDRLIASVSVLMESCQFAARSIAELLALPLPQAGRLLLICDDQLADGGAIALMEQLPQARTLVCLDAGVPQERLEQLWSSGADGLCCRQHCGGGRLLQAVLMLLRGLQSLDPVLGERLRQQPPRSIHLRSKEQQLMELLARGFNSREIAALQQRRSDTIRRQLSDLYRKVGVRDQRGLIAWGLGHGFLRGNDLACRRPDR